MNISTIRFCDQSAIIYGSSTPTDEGYKITIAYRVYKPTHSDHRRLNSIQKQLIVKLLELMIEVNGLDAGSDHIFSIGDKKTMEFPGILSQHYLNIFLPVNENSNIVYPPDLILVNHEPSDANSYNIAIPQSMRYIISFA